MSRIFAPRILSVFSASYTPSTLPPLGGGGQPGLRGVVSRFPQQPHRLDTPMPCRFLRQQVRLIVAALVFALFHSHRHPRHRVELAAQLLCRAAGEQLAVALGGALRAVELEAQQALAHRILIEQGRGAPPPKPAPSHSCTFA